MLGKMSHGAAMIALRARTVPWMPPAVVVSIYLQGSLRVPIETVAWVCVHCRAVKQDERAPGL